MTSLDTIDFYSSRARQEQRCVEAACSPAAAAIHREMEMRYRELIAQCLRLEANRFVMPAHATLQALKSAVQPALA